MPVDIAVHPLGNPVAGNHPPAPPVPLLQSQTALAHDTASAVLVVPRGGAVLALTATVKQRVDIQRQADAGALNPGGSGIVLFADQPRLFSLPFGNYQVMVAAYI